MATGFFVNPLRIRHTACIFQAMLNFGLSELRLVDPFTNHLGEEALARARGAKDVLRRARVYKSVEDATKGLTLTVAATASNRFSAKGSCGGFGVLVQKILRTSLLV